jgi:uncharacterized membrane protein YeaQ/YmgE (transglycosylase-associated protein family)
MTITLVGLIFLLVVAAICGAVGRAIAGEVRGGLIVSIAVGFVGALLGPWLARQLSLPEPFMLHVGGVLPCSLVDHRRALFVAIITSSRR